MKKHLRLSAAAFVLLSALAVSSLTPCSAQAGNDALSVTSVISAARSTAAVSVEK